MTGIKTWQKLKKNPGLWNTFFTREKIIIAIRKYFHSQKFHEVETPLLVPSVIPESYLEVFTTQLFTAKRGSKKLFLTTSPEASLKKLLVAGVGNCFEVTKSFRNTEVDSPLHNPEFTILEWYRVNADYMDMMSDCQRLIFYILDKIFTKKNRVGKSKTLNNHQIYYQGANIELTLPWKKISIGQALEKYARISLDDITNGKAKNDKDIFSLSKIAKIAERKGYSVKTQNTWEQLFNQIFLNEIEPRIKKMDRPVFLYDYPKPLAALAKLKDDDRRLAQRFELYIGGLELADCYSELTDYKEQRQRFVKEEQAIKQNNKTAITIDQNFLDALKDGLPVCAGVALGVDRLVMLLTDTKSIQDTLLFPINTL